MKEYFVRIFPGSLPSRQSDSDNIKSVGENGGKVLT
jgi:hypothetical protein